MSDGGDGAPGRVGSPSAEHRKRISETVKKRHAEGAYDHVDRSKSEETRRKISVTKRRNPFDPKKENGLKSDTKSGRNQIKSEFNLRGILSTVCTAAMKDSIQIGNQKSTVIDRVQVKTGP